GAGKAGQVDDRLGCHHLARLGGRLRLRFGHFALSLATLALSLSLSLLMSAPLAPVGPAFSLGRRDRWRRGLLELHHVPVSEQRVDARSDLGAPRLEGGRFSGRP